MSKFTKCPKCDLNYIQSHESCCKLCDPKTKRKSLTEILLEEEERKLRKWTEYKAHKQANQDFYAYRYNQPNRQV